MDQSSALLPTLKIAVTEAPKFRVRDLRPIASKQYDSSVDRFIKQKTDLKQRVSRRKRLTDSIQHNKCLRYGINSL